jgi:hypothetical protein
MNVATLDLGYFSANVLARIKILSGYVKIDPYGVVGAGLGYLLTAQYHPNIGNNLNLEDRTKSMDIGLVLGGGALISLSSNGAVQLEVRYDLGLASIDDSGSDTDIKNRVFSFLVGYQTDLGFLSGAAPAASKSSLPVAEPPANDNEPAPSDAVPTAGEPEAETEKNKADPEPNDVPSPE